jgi:methyltransferase (TIGR00027 family)
VAAHRLGFERLVVPGGDPGADDRLAADVAGPDRPGPESPLHRYLRARTAFFDRVVVNALARGVTQVLSLGAGYDGRALRYATADVRWWEVDRPGTQEDKRARLDRLGIETPQVTFIPHDLGAGELAGALLAAGWEPDASGLALAEGLAVYLPDDVLEGVLDSVRAVAAPGSRFALSLGTTATDTGHAERVAALHASVAELGEPARTTLSPASTVTLLRSTRWRRVELSERSRQLGFTMLAPEWSPVAPGHRGTAGGVGRFMERMLWRSGGDELADHLAGTYGVAVRRTRQLDLGVHRVDRVDGSAWIARVFPAVRTRAAVEAEASLLEGLAAGGYPAEQRAADEPVSVHAGQPVLVTGFLPGAQAPATVATYRSLGELLGRLHTMDPPAGAPPAGGAWHHLALDCSPADEIAATADLLGHAGRGVPVDEQHLLAELTGAVAGAETYRDLPSALVHPDPVPRNLRRGPDGIDRLVDWTGSGVGPRLASLGCLLWAAAAAGDTHVRAALWAYRDRVTLQPDELEGLAGALRTRPLVLACWNFATRRSALNEAVGWWRQQAAMAERGAQIALAALAPGPPATGR